MQAPRHAPGQFLLQTLSGQARLLRGEQTLAAPEDRLVVSDARPLRSLAPVTTSRKKPIQR